MADDPGPKVKGDGRSQDGSRVAPGLNADRRRPGRQNYSNEELIALLRDPAMKLQEIEIELLTDELERRRGPFQPVLVSAFVFWIILDVLGLMIWVLFKHHF